MAAGLGFKTFTTGEVLTAADVNGYLMQGILVFANATARDAAITSPQEGQCCYLKDTDAVLTYSGSAWVGFDDSNAIQNSIINAKGDLISGSANDTPAILSVGSNGETLVADSSAATGLKWAAGIPVTLNAQTATYTVVLGDAYKLVTMSVASANDFQIPTNASVAFPVGTVINVIQIGAGQTTIKAVTPGTTTISSTGATATTPKLRAQYSAASCIKVATDTWYVVGDIA